MLFACAARGLLGRTLVSAWTPKKPAANPGVRLDRHSLAACSVAAVKRNGNYVCSSGRFSAFASAGHRGLERKDAIIEGNKSALPGDALRAPSPSTPGRNRSARGRRERGRSQWRRRTHLPISVSNRTFDRPASPVRSSTAASNPAARSSRAQRMHRSKGERIFVFPRIAHKA